MSTKLTSAVAAVALCSASAALAAPAKNVILLVADGAGANTYKATGYYQGKFNNQVYNNNGFISTHASNYPLRFGTAPIAGAAGLAQDPNVVYDPARAFDITPVGTTQGGYADNFAGYKFHKNSFPDSANTISAIMTGQKTYNNAVNVDGNGNPLTTFAQIAKNSGRSVGVVSSVQWADATPAVAGGAQNIARGNRTAIANQMLTAGILDVVIGGGNPDYDNDGVLRGTPNNAWISSTDWNDLKDGNNTGLSSQWQLSQNKSDFEALANDTLDLGGKKFLGTFRSFDAHQGYRSGVRGGVTRVGPNPSVPSNTGFPSGSGFDENLPLYTDALRNDVPSLTTMAKGALNILDNNPNGMYLMVEGGSVDRAMHANSTTRMIEEMIEFNEMVESVNAYLTANGGAGTNGNNYSNTLVIVTGDHDHLVTGANGDTNAFDEIIDAGTGVVPATKWQFNSHSNFTIPLFAKGPGSELLLPLSDSLDQVTLGGRTFGNGAYLDQTELFGAFVTAIPEPTSVALLIPAAMVLRRRR